jgi:hypothetical protein
MLRCIEELTRTVVEVFSYRFGFWAITYQTYKSGLHPTRQKSFFHESGSIPMRTYADFALLCNRKRG